MMQRTNDKSVGPVRLLAGLVAAAVMLIGGPAALAADDGDAAGIMAEVSAYYKSLDSLSFTVVMDQTQTVAGQSDTSSLGYRFTVDRPNRISVHPALDEQPINATIISDGETVTMYVEELDRYARTGAPMQLEGLVGTQEFQALTGAIGQLALPLFLPDAGRLLDPAVANFEYRGTVERDGETYDVVRSMADPMLPFDYEVTRGEGRRIVRITPDFTQRLAEARRAGQDVQFTVTIAIRDFNAAPQITDETFAFAVPEGANEVESILGMPKAIAVGNEAPGFELDRLGGEAITLASHRDKDVVILDFWATWCGPCRAAMPVISQVAGEFADRNVVLYAVNLQETDADATTYLRDEGLDIRVLMDRTGQVATKYGVSSIPTTVVIGKDGVVKAVHTGFGPGTGDQLRRELETLLGDAVQ